VRQPFSFELPRWARCRKSRDYWGFFRRDGLRTGGGDLGIRENRAHFLRQSPFAEQAPPVWGRTGGRFLTYDCAVRIRTLLRRKNIWKKYWKKFRPWGPARGEPRQTHWRHRGV